MRTHLFKRGITLLFSLILMMVLAGCGQQTATHQNGKLKIVATTNFYGEAAKAVVGNKGTVTSIINKPSMDPHDYEPTTNTAKKVSGADFIIANGLGYDSWMDKLANNSDDHQYIKVGERVMGLKKGVNPHIWYNPTMMKKFVTYFAKQLAKQQPQNKKYFEANAQKYIRSMKPIDNDIAKLQQIAKKSSTKQVYVSEPIFDYSLQKMGFKVANPSFENAIEKGTDPSVKSIEAMQTGIQRGRIRFFVDNKQVTSTTVTNFVHMAKKHHIPVLKVTETQPANETYVQWMNNQYQALIKQLQ
jgi:ABC-type metal ion transport system, periplasmic component/surface adhesin